MLKGGKRAASRANAIDRLRMGGHIIAETPSRQVRERFPDCWLLVGPMISS
jgi:hypothetical protein